jgi:magnesium-transporting ATPase (P-type)
LFGNDTAIGDVEPLTGKFLVMRETNLRNCDYIIGLVVYTGNDTKIQMSNRSSAKAKEKKSRIMRMVRCVGVN